MHSTSAEQPSTGTPTPDQSDARTRLQEDSGRWSATPAPSSGAPRRRGRTRAPTSPCLGTPGPGQRGSARTARRRATQKPPNMSTAAAGAASPHPGHTPGHPPSAFVCVVMPTDPNGEHRHEKPRTTGPPCSSGHQPVVTFNPVSWDTHPSPRPVSRSSRHVTARWPRHSSQLLRRHDECRRAGRDSSALTITGRGLPQGASPKPGGHRSRRPAKE